MRYLQNALEKKAVPTLDGRFVGECEERVRLLRTNVDLREMELAKERGMFVALPDVESTLADLVVTTKGRVMAMPARLAPELIGETSHIMIQAQLEKACKKCLAYLAKSLSDGGNADIRRTGEVTVR